ncbi:MAG: hypothetical protein F7C33_04265 [Desulfurococcales archaeon]|nr:hypothetical protein [Desulfurococcales archaeon]
MKRIRIVLVTLVVLASFPLSVNAPSIASGYGFITLATALAALLLDPRWALATVFLGELAGLPIIALSKSMLLPVAVLGLVLRPLVAYAASLVTARKGPLAGVLALSALTPLVATLAGILYYGDDGIHVGLSVFNTIVVLLAYTGLIAWRRDKALGLLSWLGTALYIAGTIFFPSPTALAGGLAAVLAPPLASKTQAKRASIGGLLLLLLVGVALGGPGLWANASILSYPFKPSSYTTGRWSLHQACQGRTNAFTGVHDPARLRIVHECVTVRGVVASIPFTADDGDYCFDLRVEDANATPVLSIGNIVLRHGNLHVEIIPRDRSLLHQLGGMVCKGDELIVTGVHVVDTDHGQWAEIHPALHIKLARRGPGPCTSLITNPHQVNP